MNVILIQPPDPPQPVRPIEDFSNTSLRFYPPWDLLCLRSYILEHTRHSCYFVDGRLQANIEKDFVGAIARIPDPKVAVINTNEELMIARDVMRIGLPEYAEAEA